MYVGIIGLAVVLTLNNNNNANAKAGESVLEDEEQTNLPTTYSPTTYWTTYFPTASNMDDGATYQNYTGADFPFIKLYA